MAFELDYNLINSTFLYLYNPKYAELKTIYLKMRLDNYNNFT